MPLTSEFYNILLVDDTTLYDRGNEWPLLFHKLSKKFKPVYN